jgi:hypothetical protein
VTIQRSSTDIAAEIASFRSARAALVNGERVVEVWRDGRRVTYGGASLSEIDAAIKELEREYEQAVNVEAGKSRRRPIGLAWKS